MLATFVLFYCNNYTAMYMHICISCLHTYCMVGYFGGIIFHKLAYSNFLRIFFMNHQEHLVIYCIN